MSDALFSNYFEDLLTTGWTKKVGHYVWRLASSAYIFKMPEPICVIFAFTLFNASFEGNSVVISTRYSARENGQINQQRELWQHAYISSWHANPVVHQLFSLDWSGPLSSLLYRSITSEQFIPRRSAAIRSHSVLALRFPSERNQRRREQKTFPRGTR